MNAPLVYATVYEGGENRRVGDQWLPIQILSLDTCCTLTRENHELNAPEEAQALIERLKVQKVNFAMTGFPARPVPIEHPKLEAHIRRYFKVVKKCAEAQAKHRQEMGR